MKTKHQTTVLAVLLGFVASCASAPKPKPVLERGWIGSDFQPAGCELQPKGERAKVYLRQVFTNTPAAQAGLQTADLILALDDEPVKNLRDFQRRVDKAKPGQILKVTAWRDGKRLELPVTVGRERYEQWHSFQAGFGFSPEFDIWPNPNFTLLPIASFHRETGRLQLSSPESTLRRLAQQSVGEDASCLSSKEGWQAWLVVFGLGGNKKIISQESVAVLTAQR
jgi:PDZ domain